MSSSSSSFLLLILLALSSSTSIVEARPPRPGFRPSFRFRSLPFYKGYNTLWGQSHQRVDRNGVTIWLDKTSGSGFKSVKPFRSGYFGASVKLQPGYTAGVNTAFYLSNSEVHPGSHDEVDIEFLGKTFDEPYTLQTNVYIRGSGDGRIIGREMKFHLWFDPTKNFHHYAIIWNPNEIIFLVDDVPIRRYQKKSAATFPQRPMWVYGSIWDASAWATDDGKYKADYKYQPFVANMKNFKATGCTAYSPRWCRAPTASPNRSGGLTRQQYNAMNWVQKYHMVYNYCSDKARDRSKTPECWL
ncbi:Probable xyloglucan endotransglucosylase/hydrolase protein 32 [Linum perenne]